MFGFVEATVFVQIGIFWIVQVQMMQQLILVVDAGECVNSTKNKNVVEKIVEALVFKQPAVNCVVSNDEKPVVTRTDDGNSEEHGPPSGMQRDERPRAEDAKPAEEG